MIEVISLESNAEPCCKDSIEGCLLEVSDACNNLIKITKGDKLI